MTLNVKLLVMEVVMRRMKLRSNDGGGMLKMEEETLMMEESLMME